MTAPIDGKCARCRVTTARVVIDGPLTVRLCPTCKKLWMQSEQRATIIRLVGEWLGRPHTGKVA